MDAGVRVGVDGAGNATILYRLGGRLVVVPWPSAPRLLAPSSRSGRGRRPSSRWAAAARPLPRGSTTPSANTLASAPRCDLGRAATSVRRASSRTSATSSAAARSPACASRSATAAMPPWCGPASSWSRRSPSSRRTSAPRAAGSPATASRSQSRSPRLSRPSRPWPSMRPGAPQRCGRAQPDRVRRARAGAAHLEWLPARIAGSARTRTRRSRPRRRTASSWRRGCPTARWRPRHAPPGADSATTGRCRDRAWPRSCR